jgi:hypothetical protein
MSEENKYGTLKIRSGLNCSCFKFIHQHTVYSPTHSLFTNTVYSPTQFIHQHTVYSPTYSLFTNTQFIHQHTVYSPTHSLFTNTVYSPTHSLFTNPHFNTCFVSKTIWSMFKDTYLQSVYHPSLLCIKSKRFEVLFYFHLQVDRQSRDSYWHTSCTKIALDGAS